MKLIINSVFSVFFILDWHLQVNHSTCKFLQVNHSTCKFLQVNHSTCKFLQVNHFLQETCKFLQDNHSASARVLRNSSHIEFEWIVVETARRQIINASNYVSVA